MKKIIQILREFEEHINVLIKNDKSLVLSLDVEIHQGGIRNWTFFKKNKI